MNIEITLEDLLKNGSHLAIIKNAGILKWVNSFMEKKMALTSLT